MRTTSTPTNSLQNVIKRDHRIAVKPSLALWMLLGTLAALCFPMDATAQFLFSDDASNYSTPWANGDNGGNGYNAWAIASGGPDAGSFIGNPSSDGMGTSGIGITAFGMFGHSGDYVNCVRYFGKGGTNVPMQIGDVFRFYWAMNFDCGTSGSKGFDLRAGSSTVFNVNNSNSSDITTSAGLANSGYGTDPMLVTLTRTSWTEYSFTMTSRSGGSTYSTIISSTANIDNINMYAGDQQDNAGQRNIYFNGFEFEKANAPYETNFDVTEPRDLTGSLSLTKTGNGNLSLTGANTHSGNTVANANFLVIDQDNRLGVVPGSIVSDHITIGAGTLACNNTFTLNANRGITVNDAASTVDVFGGSTVSYGGIISSSGSGVLTKDGAGTFSVSGSINTDVRLDNGRLEASIDDAIDDAASITLDGGILDLQTDRVASITGTAGTLELDAGETLTVDALSLNGTSVSAANGSVLVLEAGTHVLAAGTNTTVDHLILRSGATLNFFENAVLTVNGTLEMQGGVVELNAAVGPDPGEIVYASGSELYYTTGSSITPGDEWTSILSPDAIRIGNGTTLNLDEAGLATMDLTVEAGGTLDQNGFDLTFAGGGTLTNNGTWTAGTNTVVFQGGNTVAGSATTTFYNVDLDGGGVDFGTNSQVDNNLRILAGGFVNSNRPTYNSNATLVYETGGNYGINAGSAEWALGTNTNNPPNVEVRTSNLQVDATSGQGLRCGAFGTTSNGSFEVQPPDNAGASPKPAPFFLLRVDNDMVLDGTGSFTVLNGDGNDLKGAATEGYYDVFVQGDLEIASGFTMTLNADIGDDLILQGDFTIDGTFDPQDRAVYFDGTVPQILTDNATTPTEFAFVRVQNETAPPTVGVLVTTDWLIDDQLDLQDGILETLTGQTLTLTSNATITENAEQSWMDGETVQTKAISGSTGIEISYGLIINPNGENLGNTTVSVTSGAGGIQSNHVFASNESIAKVWQITPTTQPTIDVDLAFNWVSAHDNGKDLSDVEGWRKPVGAVAWKRWEPTTDLSGTGSAFNTIGTMLTDTFSQFTFSDGANPLPVELVDFIGNLVQGGVDLSWTTAAELNNSHFVVERSNDGFAFGEIGHVQGAGTTTRLQEYGFFDAKARPGMNYYRLRQVDLDGTETPSNVIGIRLEGSQDAAVYPVPATDMVYLEWTFQTDRSVTLQLMDARGQVLRARSAEGHKGLQRFALDVSALPAGLYQLVLQDAGGSLLHRAPVSVQ